MVKRIYCLQQFDAGIEIRYQIDELLEPLQRQFFQMIDNRGGSRIGMKKALWQMLIEHAFKFKEYYDYDAPQEMEFLNVWQARWKQVSPYQHTKENAGQIITAIHSTLIKIIIQKYCRQQE